MIAVIDYGAGNLRSVQNSLAEIGAEHSIVTEAQSLVGASKIILPGVGHFRQMMRSLDEMSMRAPLIEEIRRGTPFLGICLGLQALFEGSEEAPEARGLALCRGTVRRFPAQGRIPHMGWNELESCNGSRLLRGAGPRPYVYFAHSYYAPQTTGIAAVCRYIVPFTAALEFENVFGVQFHPEKSGEVGLRILKNFVDL